MAVALVLVAASHAVPYWVLAQFLPANKWFRSFGPRGFQNIIDALSIVLPLILCFTTPARSGLALGRWRGHARAVLGICLLPVVLTAAIYPFTSQPFKGDRAGAWLLSPLAQDLLFTGYLYGRFDQAFPAALGTRFRIHHAVLLTAMFFMLWHLPNFFGMNPGYVTFQLVYTFLGGAWLLLARQLTGSILPGLATHMLVNFIAVRGW